MPNKTCNTCGLKKSVNDFYKQTSRGLFGVRGSCKTCDGVKKKAYREDNKNRISMAKKADYDENRSRHLSQKREYRQANKGKINHLVALRKKVIKTRTPKWLNTFDKLKIQCIYSVAAMLTRENKEPWHVDHIIPLQGKNVSGLHVPSNLWFIPGKQNISKKNKFEVAHA